MVHVFNTFMQEDGWVFAIHYYCTNAVIVKNVEIFVVALQPYALTKPTLPANN